MSGNECRKNTAEVNITEEKGEIMKSIQKKKQKRSLLRWNGSTTSKRYLQPEISYVSRHLITQKIRFQSHEGYLPPIYIKENKYQKFEYGLIADDH